ncbi:hypothetical protein F0562_017244 [Nyssa sinensis]|uniref:Uncharacterized protein n=1 Tax=Nyssa sinensis TaxID=561372 RepID=A0A5J4ZHC4_9ASTE|nr:hypothetical protein F0562_017244 [Nyssa sinensis]
MAGMKDIAVQSSMPKEPNHEWVESIINCRGAHQANQSQTEKPPQINGISQMLRDTYDFGKYYEPRFVSIGPNHYGSPKLQEGQNFKPIIANKFVSNDRQQLQALYEKLFERMEEVKECYGENLKSKFDKEKLAEIMLLDGCFILYYIKCVQGGKIYKHNLEMKSHVIAFVQRDLFLLENQLPFFVLGVLMDNSKILEKDQWMQNINVFIQNNTMAPQNKEWKELQPLNYDMERPATHLLELLHQRMVSPIYYMYTRPNTVRFTFRGLTELTAVGIQLKPANKGHLTEIDYDSSTATLKIPSITVDESTKSKLLNLIAYEMCPDAQSDLVFTNYTCFMDLLIDNPEDVKKLRSQQILQNCLHSDHDVAQIFNEIGANLVSIPYCYKYEILLKNIQRDYEDKKRRYMAEFRAEHCKNPWTIFAFFGAIFALLLTGTQTYFQIWQEVFYGVYGIIIKLQSSYCHQGNIGIELPCWRLKMDEDVSIESCMLLDFDRLGRILAFRYEDEACQSQNEKPPIAGIYRIPQMLRDNNKFGKYYKPRYHLFLPTDSRQVLGMIMLLDGCFILYYIKCVVEERISRSDLKMIGHVIAIVQEDLFLLENQLPFFVLRLLMRNSTILTEDQWMQKISMFIQKNIMTSEKNEVEPLNYEMERPANLLELLHQRMVDPAPGSYKYTQSKPERFTFPSLKQLTAVGIQLKPGHTNRLTEIDYDSSTATLKIPSITVDESTKSKLLNLIAYEMCPDTHSDLVFTTYVFLMDLFIRDPDDVKELCSANILHNFLHSDGEVAQLFNEIGANWGLVPLTYKR